MRKALVLTSSIFLLILTGCIGGGNQLIRVADKMDPEPNLGVITNDKDISDIMEIVDKIEWKEDTLDRPNRDDDIEFWIEKEGVDERLANYEVWIEEDQTVIFNSVEGKVGQIKNVDAEKLKQFLTE
ncbi:hypothetical protein [Neobacillus sp. LXY-4]|uniref:hypothetical protein n=1 Tax=Neobacillus sp. LXY-4 TaxID=3379826 RepID=UPI003EE32867